MKKLTRSISTLLVILVFVFSSVGATIQNDSEERSVTRSAISNYRAVQKNSQLPDEDKIKSAIETYFVTRYEGQKLLEMQSFSILVDDDASSWVKKEKDKREIELYVAQLFELSYQSYDFQLNYGSIDIQNNKATVSLKESHQVVFQAIAPEVSEMSNLEHIITLHQKQDGWVITDDQYSDELTQALAYKSKDEIKKQVDENYQQDVERKKNAAASKTLARPIASVLALINYSYNRTAARQYADAHIPTEACPTCGYNTAYYKTELDTDCANFVSQAIYAGEGKTPPDTSGFTTSPTRSYTTDWYYVFNNPAYGNNGSGSYPWIRVVEKYTFITTNTSKIGPYGFGTSNLCDIGIGDVVQIKNGGVTYDHEGIVVGKGTGCGTLSNTLVDAHTTDRYHYPISYWAGYSLRYIRISGWKGN